ncbi:MAG TPA: DUF4062 domain-containing protein [bacterium]|nr:DUF4062 domain-containing protein [bacterium]HQJ65789.1 DUF4062 domain-containing protein [bacterium]
MDSIDESRSDDVFQNLRWEKVYIFISSTFNDMHAERDVLVKKVFPQLADWCEARRLRMVDIDLRWGVTEQDATRNQNVVQVCLQRIDECRPFFLCLLGQRYGWVPSHREVSAETLDSFPGLAEAIDDGRSVTELEILHAIVRPFSEQSEQVISGQALFYQRHPASLRHLPHEPTQLWRTFTDIAEPEPAARRFLLTRRRQLRKKILPATQRPVVLYRGTWDSAARSPELAMPLRCPSVLPENVERWRRQWQKAGVTVEGLDVADRPEEEEKARRYNERLTTGRLGDLRAGNESFPARVLTDLQVAIETHFPGRTVVLPQSPLAVELSQQEQFQFAAAEGFIERKGDFAVLDAYALGESCRPFVLTAPGGAGKSMLLACWIDRLRAEPAAGKNRTLLYRFIGASDQSTSVINLINSLLLELKDSAGRISGDLPDDPVHLRQAWPELLAQAASKGPLFIVIDSLDQLNSGLDDLTWVPRLLPPDVKFIISFRSDARGGENAIAYFQQGGAYLAEVPPFQELNDRRKLVQAYLDQYLKELDTPHLEALITSPGASNPLFLKVALSELRIFGAFGNLAAKIQNDFGTTPASAFTAVLRRLETDPAYSEIDPSVSVPLLFGLMAHARRGLSGDELATMLCTTLGENSREPAAWERAKDATYLVLRQVRPFLARRQGRFDFFYETFRQAASTRYVIGNEGATAAARPAPAWHTILGNYFHALPLWIVSSGNGRSPNERKTGELPYHLSRAGEGKRLEKVLTDLEFIEAKSAAGQMYELVDDYLQLPESMRTIPLTEFADFVRHQAHILARWPELTFQQAANTILSVAIQGSQSAPAKAAIYRQLMGLESRPWIRRLNPEPTAGACLMTLAGHEGAITAVAVTPNGERLISAGVDNTLRVWDLRTGSAMEIIRDFVASETRLTLIPGSSLVAVTGSGGRIVLWDYEHLQPAGELAAPGYKASSLAVDASGRYLAAGASTLPAATLQEKVTTILLYDLQSGKAVDFGSFTAPVNALALSRGARLLIAGSGSALQTIDTNNRAVTGTAHTSGEYISWLRFAPDECTVVASSWGGDIQFWKCEPWQVERTIHSRQGVVQDLTFSPNGSELAGAGIEGSIIIWDLIRGEMQTILRGHIGPVSCVAFTPDGARLVSGCADGMIRVWDPNFDRDFIEHARKQLREKYGTAADDRDPVRSAALFEGLLYLMSGSRKHFNSVTCVEMGRSGQRAVTGSLDDTVRSWKIEKGTTELVFEGHKHGLSSLALSSDERRIAAADRSATIKIWDMLEGVELASRTIAATEHGKAPAHDLAAQLLFELQRPTIAPLRFVNHDQILVSADSLDSIIKAWDATTLKPLFKLAGHQARVRQFLCTADGRNLVSSGDDGQVILWEIASGRLLVRGGPGAARNSANPLSAISLAGNGTIVCAWPDGSLRLLDPARLAEIDIIGARDGHIAAVSASGDIAAVVRNIPDGTVVEILQLSRRSLLFSIRSKSKNVRVMCCNEGQRIIMGGVERSLVIRDIGVPPAMWRFPLPVSCFDQAGNYITAGTEIGDVFLLELKK